MNKLTLVITGSCLIALGSCIKGETPVPRHPSGNVIVAAADMDPTYKYQVYYNLKERRVVGVNLKTIWDIGFETAPDGWRVTLNTAKSMFALRVAASDFVAVSAADTAGFAVKKQWDSPTGASDSTAIGDWRTDKPTYLIDRGYDEMGRPQGFMKMQLLAADKAGYRIRFADLNSAGDTTITVTKDTVYNRVFLSFASRAQVAVEPPKTDWDIVFTQYTHIFYNEQPPTPYLVTGCLLNSYNTAAIADTSAFDAIDWAAANRLPLSVQADAIGYNWKTYNGVSYVVNSGITYLVRDARNLWYKLRFTGFYNNAGQKGCPQWEYKEL